MLRYCIIGIAGGIATVIVARLLQVVRMQQVDSTGVLATKLEWLISVPIGALLGISICQLLGIL